MSLNPYVCTECGYTLCECECPIDEEKTEIRELIGKENESS